MANSQQVLQKRILVIRGFQEKSQKEMGIAEITRGVQEDPIFNSCHSFGALKRAVKKAVDADKRMDQPAPSPSHTMKTRKDLSGIPTAFLLEEIATRNMSSEDLYSLAQMKRSAEIADLKRDAAVAWDAVAKERLEKTQLSVQLRSLSGHRALNEKHLATT